MSTVTHAHIKEGDDNAAAQANSTMAAWVAGTADYGEDNIRPGGVDARNLDNPRYNTSGSQFVHSVGSQTLSSDSSYTAVSLAAAIIVNYVPGTETFVRIRYSVYYELAVTTAGRHHTGFFRLESNTDGAGWVDLNGGGSERIVQLGLDTGGGTNTTYGPYENRGQITALIIPVVSGSAYQVRLVARNTDSAGASGYVMTIISASLGIETAGL